MAGEVFDYMIGLVIISMTFVSAVVVVPNLSYVNLLYVDQQQLRNIALGALKTILLDTGYPVDWGGDNFEAGVERFGLALAGSSSFYVLDPYKVQRLVIGNPAGFIEYEDIRTKLGLQGYGFNLRIIPPFKAIVNDKDSDGESNPITLEDLVEGEGVEVFVTLNDGRPIPSASVEVTLIYVLENVKDNFFTAKASGNVNALGKCIINILDFKPDIPDPDRISDFIIVSKVTVADLATVTSSHMEGFGEQHTMNASIVGETITLSIPEGVGWEKGSAGARWVESAMIVNEDGVWTLYNGTKSDEDKITWGGEHWSWSRLFSGLSYYNPLFIIFNFSIPNPRRSILFLGLREYWTGFEVGQFTGARGASVKVQRDVIISGMTYIAEMTLWKESL